MTSASGTRPSRASAPTELMETAIIGYVLQFTDRKSLEISVYPDGAVVVKAPMIAALADVEAKIKKRARWIRKQLRYFAQFEPRVHRPENLSVAKVTCISDAVTA